MKRPIWAQGCRRRPPRLRHMAHHRYDEQNHATHLVNHVCQQALDFVRIDSFLTAKADGSRELGDGDSGPADRCGARLLCFLESAGDEDLAQEVAQGNVTAAFQRQVNPATYKLFFAFLEGQVEIPEVACTDAAGQGEKELLQAGERLEQFAAWEGVGGEEMARD